MTATMIEQAGWEWAAAVDAVHAHLTCRFRRAEPRRRAKAYLESLLSTVERKNGWQLAEYAGEATPSGMQRLLASACWDTDAVRDDLRAYVVEHVGAPGGVLIVDETGFLKQGTKSAGVARQYRGTAGRRENQQVGVFLAYASPRGCAFIDRARSLPEQWTADGTRCAEAGVPTQVEFATRVGLAKGMLARAFAARVPAAWVVGDTVYGTDELRRWLEDEDRSYVLAVPGTHGIWTAGQQVEVQALAARRPGNAWVRLSAGDGSQGPRWYEWACLALPYECRRGMAQWLLARRSVSDPVERAYYRVDGPTDTPPAELVRVAGQRWCIATALAEAKSLVGLDHYEVRRWSGWHRHITLCLLAHAALIATRAAVAETTREKGEVLGWWR
jgi:SRSO17 transposase